LSKTVANMSTSIILQKNPWVLAFESLSQEDKVRLQKYHPEGPKTVDETLQAIQEKQKASLEKRWTVKIGTGRRIIIRDILDKIVFWINKFKEIGDVVAQYDPTYSALPWASMRFLLNVSTNDLQAFANLGEGLETVARLTSRFSVFEAAYLPAVGHELTPAQSKLCEALVSLYSQCLGYLATIGKYYERSTGERIVRSFYEFSDRFKDTLKTIALKEAEVESLASIVQTEYIRDWNRSLGLLEQKNHPSFQSLETLLHSLEEPLFRLIVKQLTVSQSGKSIRQSVWEEYNRHREITNMDELDPSALTIEECTQLLLTMMLDCPATIIIDGLDELYGEHLDLLDALHTLTNESSSIVKVLISSCDNSDIALGLEGAISLSISASENSTDIYIFVQHKVKSTITSQRLLGGNVSKVLEAHLINTLIDGEGSR
jgi:hypothetical protein